MIAALKEKLEAKKLSLETEFERVKQFITELETKVAQGYKDLDFLNGAHEATRAHLAMLAEAAAPASDEALPKTDAQSPTDAAEAAAEAVPEAPAAAAVQAAAPAPAAPAT